ncbi:MAG TPA: ABC transporter transmembrane domain-containing protein [Terriglobia bacterium]|nr:ABC transporter transmembrane domain-containing protein [Terriglobia bacterium]
MIQVKRLLGFIRPYSFRLAMAVLLMVVVGASEGITALLIKPIFDRVLAPGGQTAGIILFQLPLLHRPVYLEDFLPHWIHNVWTVVAITIVAVALAKGVSEFLATYFINYIGHSVVRDLRNLLYSKLIGQSISFFTRNPTGRLMSAITSDIERIQYAVSQTAADTLKQSFTLIALLAALFYYDWVLALISMILIPLVVFPSARLGRYIRASSRSSQDKMADLNNVLQETFSGIRIVKAFAMESFEIEKFKATTRRLLRVSLRWVRAQAVSSPLMEVLGAITIAGLLFYERQEILHHAQTTGGFIGFLFTLLKSYEPVKRLTGVSNSYQQALGASEQVFHYLDSEPEMVDRPGAVALPTFEREIAFEQVEFDYEDGVPLLRDINLHIGKGEVVALVGSSGAGKTTLASLIPRFFDVTRGRIAIDGQDVRDLKLNSLRAQIGIVTQETILFNDTVYNNICYGSRLPTDAQVREAARVALAEDFILEMPQGYETLIGERGQRLSGGQRQRIAIARALLKNPPILILDEATSELDTESELLVQRALANLMAGRTVVVIAHRLSTVRRAERIVVIDRGTICEIGTHDDLVGRGGIYQRLHDLQFVDVETLESENRNSKYDSDQASFQFRASSFKSDQS